MGHWTPTGIEPRVYDDDADLKRKAENRKEQCSQKPA